VWQLHLLYQRVSSFQCEPNECAGYIKHCRIFTSVIIFGASQYFSVELENLCKDMIFTSSQMVVGVCAIIIAASVANEIYNFCKKDQVISNEL
jgi:hypothetical protein